MSHVVAMSYRNQGLELLLHLTATPFQHCHRACCGNEVLIAPVQDRACDLQCRRIQKVQDYFWWQLALDLKGNPLAAHENFAVDAAKLKHHLCGPACEWCSLTVLAEPLPAVAPSNVTSKFNGKGAVDRHSVA